MKPETPDDRPDDRPDESNSAEHRLKDRLGRLHNHLGAPPSATRKEGSPAKNPAPTPAPPPRYLRLARALDAELATDPSGIYCVATRVYPFGDPFGNVVVPPPFEPPPIASFEANYQAGELDISRALFFDTETTGLGGVGAVAFLVGCGSVTPEGFEIRQYVLPDYSDEAAMLERLLLEFGDDRCLVSYNGRAFDLPLVRDRMIVNRVARNVPCAHHVDLLHSARRLWRRRLQDCSLTNIEREVFGFFREDDIPGYLVPSVYFDWLGSEEVGLLPSVLEHNRWDILTLYVLLARVAEVVESGGAALDHVDDMYSLSRVFERRRERDKVTDMYRRIDAQAPDGAEPEVIWFHSLAFKRQGDWDQAVSLWQRLADTDARESFGANLELAKYFEHRVKDAAEAYRYAKRAAALCPSAGPKRDQVRERLNRLKKRLA